MPITPTYPGVYIQELASDVRTIVPVDTATTAFIGGALRGPVNEPVTIFGFEDFESQFGGLWLESKLGFAVRDFFLNGGSKAIIVRAFRPMKQENDPLGNPARLALNPQASQPNGAPANTADVADIMARLTAALKLADAKDAEAKAKAVEFEAKDQLANSLEALAKSKAQELAAREAEQKAAAKRLDAANAAAKANPDDADLKQKATDAQTANATIGTAVTAATQTAQTATTQAEAARAEAETAKAASASAKTEAEKAQTSLTEAREKAAQAAPGFQLEAASAGRWGEQLALRVTKETNKRVLSELTAQYGVHSDELFNLTIRDLKTSTEEYFPNVTLSEGPRRLDRVLNAQSQLVRVPDNALDTYNGGPPQAHADPPERKDWWDSPASHSIVTTKVSDGLLGTDTAKDTEAIKAAIQALDHADLFNMLCIPPYDSSGDVDAGVLAEAASYCEKRRAMLIVDPPVSWTSWKQATKGFPIPELSPSANAAIFFPRLRKRNPLRDNQVEEYVPCGAVAGVMARTDFRRGVWKAAAGLEATLNGVEGFSVQLDDNANGQLNPLGINCLRVMPGAGPVIWGARTTVGDDRLANQWKYIPVRRMALWIEETLYRNTQWAVFEPNDEPLWSSLRLNIGNFMNGLFRQGAFQGKSPTEAYFVRCDASTTTQTDIDRGIVNVVVGFAPLKPAEFVIISIKQISNQGAA